MSVSKYVARLLIDGVVVVPDVLDAKELAAMQAAFEKRAAEVGKRWMNWDDVSLVPEFVAYIAHPRLMEVVDAFTKHFGHDAVFANTSGTRDAYDPARPDIYNPPNLRYGNIGWHDDVMGMKNPNAEMLPTSLTSLLYLDDTFADNGAYCSAMGSHHLAGATADHKPILANSDYVLDNCELRPHPLKAGSVIIHRSHEWHGVVPPKQRRRLVLQTFSTRAQYDMQIGHTQLSDETLAMIAPERHKYLTTYSYA